MAKIIFSDYTSLRNHLASSDYHFFLNLKMMKENIFHNLTIKVSKICMICVPNYFEFNELLNINLRHI